MRNILLTIVLSIVVLGTYGQEINIVGTWNEQGVDRTWIFNANGTKTLKGSMNIQLPISGYSVPCELIQTRTEENWKLVGKKIQFTAIPLQITNDIKVNYSGISEAIKAKIKAGIPKIKQQAVAESKADWQANMVGRTYSYTITSFSPERMVIDYEGQSFVLIRDISKMTAEQKAAFQKEMAIYKESLKELEATADSKVYDTVEQMPRFAGLVPYISTNLKYPESAKQNGVQGRVIASFIVERDGSISDVKVEKSVDPEIDKEAIRLIKEMPKWTPGKQNGVTVRVKYTIPIQFKLQ